MLAAPSSRKMQGLSMDMNLNSPYLLPTGMRGSRESFRSLSRSINDEHDPYRPVTRMHNDTDSIRSVRHPQGDQGSIFSAQSPASRHPHSAENAGLIANARPMSQSFARRGSADDRDSFEDDEDDGPPPPPEISRKPPPRKQSLAASEHSRPGSLPPKDLPLPPEPVAVEMPPPPRTSSYGIPPRKDSQTAPSIAAESFHRRSSYYEDYSADLPSLPALPMPDHSYDINPALIFTDSAEAEQMGHNHLEPMHSGSAARLSVMGGNGNRLSVMGLRPLPPDMPDDTPEVRANRIRSFYREYFDESKPAPVNGQWEDDYDPAFLDAYDRPFAQGPARRAFTPPPRGPPRGGPHQRKFSTMSAGRHGPRGRQGAPAAKKLPPPMPLTSLPTPHLLKDDVVVFNPIDFAPPSTFRNAQNGSRPDSPAGTPRPYSPAVRAFTPLASSFDTLTVMPSPHELRKSSTFTALDFALPSRFRNDGGNSLSPSDAGSIRSYRSGISAVQSNAIRQGAYRVSRLPSGVVTTKDDLASQLRPRMDLVERA